MKQVVLTGVAQLVGSGVYLRRGLLAALVLTAVFWGVTTLAQRRGERNAELTELTLVLQPQAVVYSERDLHLPGSGRRTHAPRRRRELKMALNLVIGYMRFREIRVM